VADAAGGRSRGGGSTSGGLREGGKAAAGALVGRENDDDDGEASRGWCRAARQNGTQQTGRAQRSSGGPHARCYNWARSTGGRSRRKRGLTVGGWTAVPGGGEWRRRRRFVWLHLHSLAHCAGGGVCVLGRPLGRVRRWEELWEERERTGVPFLRVTPVVVALFRKWTATWVFMGQFITFHFGRGKLVPVAQLHK